MLADPVVGQTLKGTYAVQRRLAAGGMGVIYEATHVRLPKRYAIKVLTQELARNENVLTRFRREAEIVAALGHPHIVDVVDFDALETGQMYMVMEFLDGEDLADRLKRGPLDLASTVRVFIDVCDALETAHRSGVVHRDLKPANVFLIHRSGRDDYAKVLDFGISKILEAAGTQMTMDQSVMGTPSYMSPEQASGDIKAIDQRTDIFALGAMLHECLTGRCAFPGTTPLAVIAKITNEPPPRVSDVRADLPPGLQEVALKAMARRREDRYQSAAELANDLVVASGLAGDALGRPISHPSLGPASNLAVGTGTQTPAPVMQSTLSAAAAEAGAAPAHTHAHTHTAAAGSSRAWLAAVAALVAVGGAAAAYVVMRGGGADDGGAAGRGGDAPPLARRDAGDGPGPTPATAGAEPRPTLQSLGALRPIAGGTFMMGTEQESAAFERPRHSVTVDAFWLAETETTNADYLLYLRRAPNTVAPTTWPSRDEYPSGKATHPVVGIDWESASAYCRWAYPDGGRLPTEQEWEWAARGDGASEFVWGNDFDPSAANYGPQSRGELAPVGSYSAGQSRDGIHDLAGNAYEWTASELAYYSGADIGKYRGRRVIRGGSFKTSEGDPLRAWYRNFDVPAKTSDEIGFRCAWSAPR